MKSLHSDHARPRRFLRVSSATALNSVRIALMISQGSRVLASCALICDSFSALNGGLQSRTRN